MSEQANRESSATLSEISYLSLEQVSKPRLAVATRLYCSVASAGNTVLKLVLGIYYCSSLPEGRKQRVEWASQPVVRWSPPNSLRSCIHSAQTPASSNSFHSRNPFGTNQVRSNRFRVTSHPAQNTLDPIASESPPIRLKTRSIQSLQNHSPSGSNHARSKTFLLPRVRGRRWPEAG